MSVLFIKRLHANAIIPKRGSVDAAGYDFCSVAEVIVPAWDKALVSTGWAVAIPNGHYGRIASRSGLAVKNNIEVGAGVIDSDYRGEVKVVLRNHSDIPFIVNTGDRIAQMVIEVISTPEVMEVDDLSITVRAGGGFGSTGISQTINENQIKQLSDHKENPVVAEPEIVSNYFDNIKITLDDNVIKVLKDIHFRCSNCKVQFPEFPLDGKQHTINCGSCGKSETLSYK